MVKEIEHTFYKCPYCKQVYKEHQQAQDCANFCVEADPPETITQSEIICEICNKKHTTYSNAYTCEEKHKENNDWRYEEYLRQQSLIALDIAQKHPAQSRITSFVKVN